MDTPTPETPVDNTPKPGFPTGLLGKVAKADPPIQIGGMDDQADITFKVSRHDLGMTRNSVARAPMAWSSFFIDLVGEVLVRKNIGRFADMLAGIETASYDRRVNSFVHRQFGLVIDHDDNRLQFQFHISLIQQILTEDLYPLINDLD